MGKASTIRRTAAIASLSIITAAAGFALGATPANAAPTNRYVAPAPTGNDVENDCTDQAQPCEHIAYAVSQAGAGDTVHVKSGTYHESVHIRIPLTLVGDGATGTAKTVVDGNGDAGPSIWVDGNDVNVATVVTIRDMAIDGNGFDDGILVEDATLHLIDARASGNDRSGVDLVGASTATIEDSTVSGNGDDGVTAGNFRNVDRVPAAVDTPVNLTISGSDVSDNVNEGVNANDASVAVDHSTINRNGDGGVVLSNVSTATIDTTTLDSNVGAGVVVNGPGNAASVHASTISNTRPFTGERGAGQPFGGGVLVFVGTADIRTSTIHRNTGQGVLALGADVTIDNSTITGTRQPAGEDGASGGETLELPYGNVAVSNDLQPAVKRSLASSYPGGSDGTTRRALAAPAAPKTTVTGSIVATSSTLFECNGPVADGGYNVTSDDTCNFGGPTAGGAVIKLGLLVDNGGPTKTRLPLKGNPAIDAIPGGKAGCVAAATDQRGVSRPQPVGNACDAGAVELKAKAIVIHPNSLPSGTAGDPYHATITATGGAYPTYAFSLAPGSSLPDGLELDAHGHITGTPTKAGTFPFTVSVNDPVLKDYTIVIEDAATNGNGEEPIAATGTPVLSMIAVGAGTVFAGFLLMLGAARVGRRPARHRARP